MQRTQFPRSEIVLIDIGANLGTFALAAAANGFSVYAFEPMLTNIRAVRQSICANGFTDRITIVEKVRYIDHKRYPSSALRRSMLKILDIFWLNSPSHFHLNTLYERNLIHPRLNKHILC